MKRLLPAALVLLCAASSASATVLTPTQYLTLSDAPGVSVFDISDTDAFSGFPNGFGQQEYRGYLVYNLTGLGSAASASVELPEGEIDIYAPIVTTQVSYYSSAGPTVGLADWNAVGTNLTTITRQISDGTFATPPTFVDLTTAVNSLTTPYLVLEFTGLSYGVDDFGSSFNPGYYPYLTFTPGTPPPPPPPPPGGSGSGQPGGFAPAPEPSSLLLLLPLAVGLFAFQRLVTA